MAQTIRVAALQKRMGGVIPTAEFESLRQKGVDLVCLPEYYFVPSKVRSQIETAALKNTVLQRLQLYSRKLVGVVVGGTLIEEEHGRYYNTCPVFDCGNLVGSYRKMFPTPCEREEGILPGTSHTVIEVRSIRLGLLICADVLYSDSFQQISEYQPHLIAIPTTSPFQPGEPAAEKQRRDNDIFVKGSQTAGAYILKTCGVGSLMRQKLQGRSLIAAPWGVLQGVSPRNEMLEATLIEDLNVELLNR